MEHKCSACPAEFPSGIALNRHIRNRHIERFRCPKCYTAAPTSTLVRIHETTCTAPEPEGWFGFDGKITCRYCTCVLLTAKSLDRHIKMSCPNAPASIMMDRSRMKAKCQYCTLEFNSQDSLSRHIRASCYLAPRPILEEIVCVHCCGRFKRQRNLDIHLARGCRYAQRHDLSTQAKVPDQTPILSVTNVTDKAPTSAVTETPVVAEVRALPETFAAEIPMPPLTPITPTAEDESEEELVIVPESRPPRPTLLMQPYYPLPPTPPFVPCGFCPQCFTSFDAVIFHHQDYHRLF